MSFNMDTQKYEKAKKSDPLIFLALGIIMGVMIIIGFISAATGTQTLTTDQYLVLARGVLIVVLMFVAFIGIRNDKIYGSVAGIIVGLLYLSDFSIIGIIFGVAIIYDCIRFIVYIKKNLS